MSWKYLSGLCLFFLLLTAFTFFVDRASGTVDQKQGLYIFMLSKPVAEYEYLGSVKKSLAWTGQPEEMLNSMIKKVKKDYPDANGIIFTSVNMERADAIKFK
jgi:hypothetical protein